MRALLSNAWRLGHPVVDPEVRTAIGQLERLPTVPKVFQELRLALHKEHATWRTVGEIIQRDMGMTAKLLKLVNSAFFGLPRRVDSPQEAVHFLGLEVVQALVLAHGVFDQTGELKTKRLKLEEVWQHSLMVAWGARALAAMEGLNRHQKADAFMGGLLHDVGVLVLASTIPGRYDEVLSESLRAQVSLPVAERELLGLTHAEVGAYLLGLWGIQPGVLEAVSLHHEPGEVPRAGFDHVMAVHVADGLAASKDSGGIFERTRFDQRALESLGLRDLLPGWERVLASPEWK